MKKYWILLLAGAVILALGVGCDKDDPKPELPFKPPHETDDSLFYYAESGEKQYFKLRKDRVIIKAASYDDAQALSGRLIPSFYTGVWVLASIDSLKMGLPEVLALPGALDATYGLEYVGDGMMQYPRNEIFIRPKAGFTPQQVFEQVGMSEEIASIELFNEYHNIYFITLDVSVGGILRRCRRLYESRICEFADPNFFRFRDNFFQIQRYTN